MEQLNIDIEANAYEKTLTPKNCCSTDDEMTINFCEEGNVADPSAINGTCSDLTTPMDVTSGEECCSICLEDFVEHEIVIMLPKCSHIFHTECIKQWVTRPKANANSCPMCKCTILEEKMKKMQQLQQDQQQQQLENVPTRIQDDEEQG
jgi:hypothetical protein